jgi:UDP-N-acetylmuramyl pentapeptide phosphotransferase/UDP-N-acetylglucosamine-1-phosphate transferase
MKASKLFILLVFTAFTILLIWTQDPVACAIAVISGLFCIFGWYDFIKDIEHQYKIKYYEDVKKRDTETKKRIDYLT